MISQGIAFLITLMVAPVAEVEADGSPKKVALLVGIHKYDKPGFEELPGAENDAKAIGEELKKLGFDVHVLLGSGTGDDRATLVNLRKQLKAVASPLTKQDLLVVALAGHGQQLETIDAEKRPHVVDFFCPVGSVSGDADTMLPLDDLLTLVGANVGQGIVLIDACRDEPDDPNRSVAGRTGRIRSRGIQGRQISVPSGMSILFSCGERQRAFEHPSERHGLFTFCLLEELRAAPGNVVWLNLAAGVTERMASPEIANLLPAGRHQTPVLASNVGRVVLGRRTSMITAKRNWLNPLNIKTPKEADRVRAELLRDARAGNATAMVRLGEMFGWGDCWTAIDKQVGLDWLRKAAEANEPAARLPYALTMSKEPGADKRRWEADAASAFNELKSQKDIPSLVMNDLGVALQMDVGVVKNPFEAFEWFRKAARLGEPAAMTNLGNCYRDASGVKNKDESTAFAWYRKAAELGRATAMNNLGWSLEKGLGVQPDVNTAFTWYHRAANLGHPMAMNNVGNCYIAGRGVAPNQSEAIRWYRAAAARDIQFAKDALKRLNVDQ